MSSIGFIGIGVMGKSMAGHLLDKAGSLVLHTRTRAKADALLAKGATWAASPAEVARLCDVVITMPGFPAEVEALYFGPEGLLAAARPGQIFMDMSTSSPALAIRIAAVAKERGALALDAPVTGGDVGAREARLVILCGGDADAFEKVLPFFRMIGKTAVLLGGPGSGQHAKLCNQIMIAGTMLGVAEALSYAGRAGLDPAALVEALSGGAAGSWTLSNLAPRMIAGDFAPGFYVKHFIKDMELAVKEAKELGLDAPGLATALERYRKLAERGGAEQGTQALYRLYGKEA